LKEKHKTAREACGVILIYIRRPRANRKIKEQYRTNMALYVSRVGESSKLDSTMRQKVILKQNGCARV
jgi:hypothetical protein